MQSFFNLVMQSRQPIRSFSIIRDANTKEQTETLVYVSADQRKRKDQLDFREFLISGGIDRDEFARVLIRWLACDVETHSARRRFLEGFVQRSVYTIDRFVGAANSFDLLPKTAFASIPGPPLEVAEFINDAMNRARMISDEVFRDRALSNLGRVTGINLAAKICMRYDSLPSKLRQMLPKGETVVRQCVRVRNYFVHGTDPRLPLHMLYEAMPFFTNFLEFTFVASDLNECGWDAERWLKLPFSTCPLRWFLRDYEFHMRKYCSSTSTG